MCNNMDDSQKHCSKRKRHKAANCKIPFCNWKKGKTIRTKSDHWFPVAGLGGEVLSLKNRRKIWCGGHILYFDCDGDYMIVFVEIHRSIHSKRQKSMCVNYTLPKGKYHV